MSDRMDPKLRELTYRLIAMAPEAPPFPEEAMVQLKPSTAPARPSRRRSPLVWVAAAAVVALVIVGVPLILFGPGDDPGPTTIPPATATTVPDVTPTTVPDDVTPTTQPPVGDETVVFFSVYLFSDDMTTRVGDPALVPVLRSASIDSGTELELLTASLGEAVASLLSEPTQTGYSSSFPALEPDASISVSLSGSVATLELPIEFEAGGGTSSMIGRLAQLVFTATQFPDIDSVILTRNSVPIEVFSGEGIVLDGPQTRADYLGTDQLIYVDTPAIGSVVGSPFTISGHANTFEATVEWELTRLDGTPITGGFTTATCGNGCWGDFSIDVEYVLEEDTEGFVNVFETSAEDGRRQHVLRYPVTLTAAEWSGPPEESAVPSSPDETAIMDTLVTFAQDPSAESYAGIPFADEVALGLGPDIVRTVPAADLANPAAWVMDIDLFRARSGTTSIFNLFDADRPRRTVTGEHLHCASPPVAAPTGLEGLIRISTQPLDATSCLEWFTVDLFVNADGEIEAVTLDLYEP